MHEPGEQTLIGRPFPDDGFEQGRAVLDMLARHPATARHIAAKLVRHFISDQPVPALADRLAERFIATDGDLKEVAKTLVTAPESWSAADRKLKRPSEWIVTALRATGATAPDTELLLQAQNLLGEPLWRPAAPKGFPDEDAAWIDGLAQRLESPINWPDRSPARPIPNRRSKRHWVRLPPTRPGPQSAAPKAGRRL
jgi:uncharacterized protein (DUF1800 family)